MLRVMLTDINKKVEYALSQEASMYFSVDSTSGIVSLRKQVDRERNPTFNVTVYAHDQVIHMAGPANVT